MYSEEQRTKALHVFHQTGSVTDVVRRLGYPSREQLYTWIRNEGKTKEKRKKLNLKNTTEHPRNPPVEFKLQVLRRCFERRKIQTNHSYGSRMPLSLARLDRGNEDKRIYQIHVTERVLSR